MTENYSVLMSVYYKEKPEYLKAALPIYRFVLSGTSAEDPFCKELTGDHTDPFEVIRLRDPYAACHCQHKQIMGEQII